MTGGRGQEVHGVGVGRLCVEKIPKLSVSVLIWSRLLLAFSLTCPHTHSLLIQTFTKYSVSANTVPHPFLTNGYAINNKTQTQPSVRPKLLLGRKTQVTKLSME
jgi:hypothetical protein